MFLNKRFHHVFRQIYSRLQGTSINWVLTGSCRFALQDIPLSYHDIDIQTDQAGAYEIEALFSEFVTRPVSFLVSDHIKSHFGRLLIDGIQVDIMGDIQKWVKDAWEAPVDLSRHKEIVHLEEMEIPVLSLAYEYEAYLKMGRAETAEILRQRLRWDTDF
jgi:hypothetical protein